MPDVRTSFEFPLATIFCHSNNSSGRKRLSDKSFTFEGHRATNFESTVLKLKSLKTLLAIIISWKFTAAIKDRKENAARRTVTAMIILANIMRCFKVTQLLANCCCCCLYLLSFLCLYSFDNTCFCEKFLNNE